MNNKQSKKKKLIIPHFKNEDEEREFWDKIDLADYFMASDFVPVSFPNLQPTTKPISIRLPSYVLNRVKERAHALDIPYQALIKEYIAKGIFSER